MDNRESILRTARAELEEWRFPVTEQVLAVHEVRVDASGLAEVARLDTTSEPGSARVYFALADQKYHFVVLVRPTADGRFEVVWVWVQPEVRLYFSIRSDTVSAAEIASRISLEPTYTRVKNAPRGRVNGTVWREHEFRFEAMENIPADLDEKLRELKSRLAAAQTSIAALKPEARVSVVVVFSAWAGNPQFGQLLFDAETTRWIADLGAYLWVDLYSFGPPMLEDREPQGTS